MSAEDPRIEQALRAIEAVLKRGRQQELIYTGVLITIAAVGIAAFACAIYTGNFAWSTPAVAASLLLVWPARELKKLRTFSVLLSYVVIMIPFLPPDQAAAEIRSTLEALRKAADNG